MSSRSICCGCDRIIAANDRPRKCNACPGLLHPHCQPRCADPCAVCAPSHHAWSGPLARCPCCSTVYHFPRCSNDHRRLRTTLCRCGLLRRRVGYTECGGETVTGTAPWCPAEVANMCPSCGGHPVPLPLTIAVGQCLSDAQKHRAIDVLPRGTPARDFAIDVALGRPTMVPALHRRCLAWLATYLDAIGIDINDAEHSVVAVVTRYSVHARTAAMYVDCSASSRGHPTIGSRPGR